MVEAVEAVAEAVEAVEVEVFEEVVAEQVE